MSKRYKILIIAGGGVFGCIPAHFLSMLPPQQQTLEGIDMLAGCSIGGILTAAYAAGHSFSQVDKVFRERASECFSKRLAAYVNPIACPTYDNDSLDKVLQDMIGNRKIGQVRDFYPWLDILIPALNITDDSYKVFDNIDGADDLVTLKEAAQMTSAAPSYYSGRQFQGKCYVDGGMIQVAPLLTATTALKAKRHVPFKDMDVFMLGTGKDRDQKKMSTDDYNGLSLLGLATKVIVPYVTLSNQMATRYWGRHIGYGSFTYFNPCLTNGVLDDVSQIQKTVQQCDDYRMYFLSSWNAWLHGTGTEQDTAENKEA